jgi:magnesium transporter
VEVRRYIDDGTVEEDLGGDRISELAFGNDGSLLWIDMAEPTEQVIAVLCNELHMERLEAEDLLHPDQRPKLERYGDHFLLVAHDCSLEDDRFISREIDVVFGDGWVLTVRKPSPDGDPPVDFQEVARRFQRQRAEDGGTDEGFFIYVLLDVVVDRYFNLNDRVDERLEELEDLVFSSNSRDMEVQRDLYRLRQTLVGFRRLAAPLREVVAALERREVDFFTAAAVSHLRDVYDHVLRVSELNESQRDLMNGALEAHLAVVSNRMNEVMKAASSWGAILIVSTLIAGIYGMNFTHMPELRWYFGYPMALASMALATAALYAMFKKRDWL